MSSYIMVRPMAQPLISVKPCPTKSSAGVKRNLFGYCQSADIDGKLEEENERTSDYLERRYKFNLKELVEKCNQQNSEETSTTQFYIDSDSGSCRQKQTSDFPELDKEPIFVVPQKNGIKRTFRVRKANKANGDSRVPKRKINLISSDHTKADSHNSEMGEMGAKKKCNSWINNDGNN